MRKPSEALWLSEPGLSSGSHRGRSRRKQGQQHLIQAVEATAEHVVKLLEGVEEVLLDDAPAGTRMSTMNPSGPGALCLQEGHWVAFWKLKQKFC
jgi:hypothetical protein